MSWSNVFYYVVTPFIPLILLLGAVVVLITVALTFISTLLPHPVHEEDDGIL